MDPKKVWKGIKDKWFILSREDIKEFVFSLIVLYILALWLFLVNEQDEQFRARLALEGVATQAVVLKCQHSSRAYHLVYQFEVVQNGQPVIYKNHEASLPAFCDKYRTGSQIPIKYLPQDPNHVAAQGNSMRRFGLTVIIIGLAYPWGWLVVRLIKAKRKKREELVNDKE